MNSWSCLAGYAQNGSMGIAPPGGFAGLSLSPREKFPKTTKKSRWNDLKLRVFKSMGASVGLPMTSIRRDA
jgi:hypothetical protein